MAARCWNTDVPGWGVSAGAGWKVGGCEVEGAQGMRTVVAENDVDEGVHAAPGEMTPVHSLQRVT